MKTVYKLLTRHNKQLHSYVTLYRTNFPFSQRYIIGRSVLPKVGKLFAFNTLENVKYFMRQSDEIEIGRVVVAEALTSNCELWERKKMMLPFRLSHDNIREFWNLSFPKTSNNVNILHSPPGTVLCDDMIVVRVLKNPFNT